MNKKRVENQAFSFSLKDPILFNRESEKFAYISIHSLKQCDGQNSFCSFANTKNSLVKVNLPEYEPRKNSFEYLNSLLI